MGLVLQNDAVLRNIPAPQTSISTAFGHNHRRMAITTNRVGTATRKTSVGTTKAFHEPSALRLRISYPSLGTQGKRTTVYARRNPPFHVSRLDGALPLEQHVDDTVLLDE